MMAERNDRGNPGGEKPATGDFGTHAAGHPFTEE
jgi:hypothetical protein